MCILYHAYFLRCSITPASSTCASLSLSNTVSCGTPTLCVASSAMHYFSLSPFSLSNSLLLLVGIHYEDGINVGESYPCLFKRSFDHYAPDSTYAGYSDPGIVVDLVHHNKLGGYIVETRTGLFGEKNHYSVEHGYIGETWERLVSETTVLLDNLDSGNSPDKDDFFCGNDW